ncbi:MAG: shikimate dehydrogenase, partial [Candidatus Omnitrophica bacterium]|nr:shikimate dehydrogenase [Candidatus Omnitrophota bacterium]
QGALAVSGLGMLLYQGVDTFELWIDEKAPVEVMRKALMEAMAE